MRRAPPDFGSGNLEGVHADVLKKKSLGKFVVLRRQGFEGEPEIQLYV
jgi:hypothetical protein